MRIHGAVSHFIAACAGAIGAWVATTGDPGIGRSFAQTPAAATGRHTTELFNRVMDDVLGRRLTVSLTERDPGNGSRAHRHPGSHTVGYVLEGTYEVKIDDGPVRTLKPGEMFYEAPGDIHQVSRNPSKTQPVKFLVFFVKDKDAPRTLPAK